MSSPQPVIYKQVSWGILVGLAATSIFVFLAPPRLFFLAISDVFIDLFLPVLIGAVILLVPIGFMLDQG